MNVKQIFQPKPTLSEEEVNRGLRMMTFEGMASLGFNSITTSGILAAFALALGANNLQIGILAAIPFIMQPLQIPTILLVEHLRKRKLLAVSTWLLAQLLWFPMALIPMFIGTPGGGAISMLLALMAIRSVLHAICNCSWNSWIRDLVPQQILGRFYSRRLALATAMAIVFGLAAAFFVDYWREQVPGENAIMGYTYILLLGALFLGLASPLFMSRMPEPLMQTPPGPHPSLRQTIMTPLRDKNFRKLMMFLLFWGFSLNLAVPFFAVYMLQRLGLPLLTVIALSVLSQVFNILFLRVWGPFADRLGSKTVLSICASLYLVVILGWTFTTMPERYFFTIPLLVILHIFAGIAAAGVTLTVGTIGLKLAPQGQATSYLAGSSLATNLGAGLGPLIGGVLADFFKVRNLAFDFTWASPARTIELGVINLTSFDFLFVITFIVGLATLNVLAAVREEGESTREVVLDELMSQTRQFSRTVSSVPALGFVSLFPFSYLRRIPGLDVATGVTAYGISDMARVTTSTVSKGGRSTARLARSLKNGIERLWKSEKVTQEQSAEVARHTARGVIHAAGEVASEPEELARMAVVGVIHALEQAEAHPHDIIWGASYGVIQGINEAEGNLTEATSQALAGARQAARVVGLDEKEAVEYAVEGILAAAESLGPEALTQVKETLSKQLPETH